MNKKIVHKVEEWMNREELEATTYQMRNFYRQLGDGFFSVLDVMNYIQHQSIVDMMKKDYDVLDVCCGRGLLLPMMRYRKKNIKSYWGVDIEPKNAIFLNKNVANNKLIETEDFYPFEVNFINSNVREMSKKLLPKQFDLIVYTSSIEHMQKEDGYKSLIEVHKVAKNNSKIILTCPNTPEDKSGYDTQYSAHIYEWKRSELIKAFSEIGFTIEDEFSILASKEEVIKKTEEINIDFKKISNFVPSEWMIPVLSPLVDSSKSKEIAFILKKNE